MLTADRAGWAVSVLSTAMFLGWGGRASRSGAPHLLPPRPTPSLPGFPPSWQPTPHKAWPRHPLSRVWCSVFPSGMEPGGKANPATWPEVLCCLPVCPREGNREDSGHHHLPSHTCPLLYSSMPPPGDRAKPSLLQKSWSGSCPPCCPPPVTWGQANGL